MRATLITLIELLRSRIVGAGVVAAGVALLLLIFFNGFYPHPYGTAVIQDTANASEQVVVQLSSGQFSTIQESSGEPGDTIQVYKGDWNVLVGTPSLVGPVVLSSLIALVGGFCLFGLVFGLIGSLLGRACSRLRGAAYTPNW